MRLAFRSLTVLSALSMSLTLAAHADTFTGTAAFSDTSTTHNNFYNFQGGFVDPNFSFSGGAGTVYTDQLNISTNYSGGVNGVAPSDNISVTVDFTEPSAESSGFSGSGSDSLILTFFGFYNGTDIDWSTNSEVVNFNDGSSVELTLPDLNYGGFGDGSSGSENLTIRVLTGPVAATPEPSSLALLGTGVLGLAGVVRRRFAV